MLLTVPRERALRGRLAGEFRRAAAVAAQSVLKGSDPESGIVGHEQRVRALLRSAYSEGMPLYAKPVVDAGGKARRKKTELEVLITQWIEEVSAKKVTQVSKTTREQLRNIMARGREEGLGTSAIATRIRREFGGTIGRARALVIARTETHSAANAAQLHAAESLGKENMKREWIAAGDERTREDHVLADGQVVALEQPFTVGGVMLMYPGDSEGPPEQIINCRCTTGFILPD